ncbi:hypothetical protein GTZ99_03015 [Novosphingobium sp. FSY-8]|uniref:Uncharacterized protein n=1 Tax=Novosphingobium ovatum TaxID=1908523 RepID=A0ABW9XAI5_9SPHN|nr:hypothetical protein [Novosphingobium ovatum]NBC35522.1 hypothetical protein [Novosphingobium ovatum]
MTAPRRRPAAAPTAPGRVSYDISPPALRVWHGIEAEDPPARRHDYPALLEMAERMLAQRTRRYPDMVRAGQIGADAAQAEIDTCRAIVADWQWIISGAGAPAPLTTLAARADLLDRAIQTIADIARDAGGFTDDLADAAQLVIAMRWHLLPERRTHSIARLNHELRAGTFFQAGGNHAR